jgi:[lysine-biosynthesis-protein LysW]--L-2-aminoadipate ligase
MKTGILLSRVRIEEKTILEELEDRKVAFDRIDDRLVNFDFDHIDDWKQYDVVLERSVSFARGLYATQMLNSWGIPTVNMAHVAAVCGDKLATTNALAHAGIPQPHVKVAFTPEAALEAIEDMGYPVVLKPVVGSWAALVQDQRSRRGRSHPRTQDTSVLTNTLSFIPGIYPKPNRDIRAFVVATKPSAPFTHFVSLDHQIRTRRTG